MILAVDVGNTNVTLGLYEKNVLKGKFFVSEKDNTIEDYAKIFKQNFSNQIISGCILSSVNDELTPFVCSAIEKTLQIKPFIISADTNFGFKIKSNTPDKIGTDRLVNAFAAGKLYSKKPAIVVDMGSATTFDIIDENGDFIGGIIMPGVKIQLDSLFKKTSKLPFVNIDKAKTLNSVINIETEKAILSGVVLGHAQAIKGLIHACEKELKKKPFIIATGGNSKLISKLLSENIFDEIRENLTLDGLNLLYEKIYSQND